MPRRNRHPRQRQRRGEGTFSTRPESYQAMAAELVRRGLASRAILGPVPASWVGGHGTKRRGDEASQ